METILQTSEPKSKALYNAAPVEPSGYVGSWPHSSADAGSQSRSPARSNLAFATWEHSRASKGRNIAETKSRGCKSISPASSHESTFSPVTSECWSFPLQKSSHQREWKRQKCTAEQTPFPRRAQPCPSRSAG